MEALKIQLHPVERKALNADPHAWGEPRQIDKNTFVRDCKHCRSREVSWTNGGLTKFIYPNGEYTVPFDEVPACPPKMWPCPKPDMTLDEFILQRRLELMRFQRDWDGAETMDEVEWYEKEQEWLGQQ